MSIDAPPLCFGCAHIGRLVAERRRTGPGSERGVYRECRLHGITVSDKSVVCKDGTNVPESWRIYDKG